MDLKELRKAIKPLGFKVKTVSYSHGRHVVYCLSNGDAMPDCAGPDAWKPWQPLLDYLAAIPAGEQLTDGGEKLYSSRFPK